MNLDYFADIEFVEPEFVLANTAWARIMDIALVPQMWMSYTRPPSSVRAGT
jgi:hypothetical protein